MACQDMDEDVGWAEYFVFAIVLVFSMSIGVFYGFFGSKQKTATEFLLANRQMSSLPVAMSLVCSAVSAITLLSNPVEIYLYGTQFMTVILAFIPFNLALAYLYIPVYFKLNVNSAYEFIEMRFNVAVRIFISALAVTHVIVSMAIAIYAPSLAINQVTGFNTRLTTAIIYLVCIFYSALGGLKAVLWTDAFQALIMLASLIAIVAKGVQDVGGLDVVFERAGSTNRVEFLNFDPDPRVRHTIWTSVVAGYFFWLPSYAATQLQVQRFLSMPTLSRARRAIVINFFGLIVIVGLCFFSGLVILAKYHDCDPIKEGCIDKTDKLVPYFVKDTVGNTAGLLGLFISGLTCASMSSLSSGLTALASITTYDYVNKLFPNLSDSKLSKISKMNTLILGMVSYLFVFVIEQMGSILPVTSSFLGIMLGPTLGLFSLGMFFPWANAHGSLIGIISTLVVMITYVIGNNTNSKDLPDQKLPSSILGCDISNDTSTMSSYYSLADYSRAQSDWKNDDDSFLIRLLSLSYMWYSGLGCILTVLFGLIASVIVNLTSKSKRTLVRSDCMSQPVLYIWKTLFPYHIKQFVQIEDDVSKHDTDDTDY